MTRLRAADDFAVICARIEEPRRERARPRAVDDFGIIRARMEEPRRERAQVLTETRDRSAIHPRPLSSCREYETEHEGRQLLLRRLNSPETLRIGPSIRSLRRRPGATLRCRRCGAHGEASLAVRLRSRTDGRDDNTLIFMPHSAT